MKTLLLITTLVVTTSFAQHSIPFASQNNTIELSVANAATVDAGNVTVEVQNAPQWLTFTNLKTQISNLKSREASTSSFTFSVDKSAPINKPHTLKFTISSPAGEKWTKEIAIQVSAPEKFELFQNYPNPFNPSTTISFQIPVEAKVKVTIFNTLGQEIVTLFDGIRSAGYHQELWNARGVASGMYIYQAATELSNGKKEIVRKTMLLVK